MPFSPPEWTAGDRIRKLREQRGLKVVDLAERAGVNKATIVNAEANRPLAARTIEAIAQALDAPADWIREGA